MVEAGGVGIFRAVENTQLIDSSRRQKRRILQNCAQLERIWNAVFWFAHQDFFGSPGAGAAPRCGVLEGAPTSGRTRRNITRPLISSENSVPFLSKVSRIPSTGRSPGTFPNAQSVDRDSSRLSRAIAHAVPTHGNPQVIHTISSTRVAREAKALHETEVMGIPARGI